MYGIDFNVPAFGPKRRVILWADRQRPGASFSAGDVCNAINSTSGSKRLIGRITLARMFDGIPGWYRDGQRLIKLHPGQMPPKAASLGFNQWLHQSPDKGTLAKLRDAFNAWASANGYAHATSWAIRPVIEAAGYRVISRSHNVPVYQRDSI